MRRLTALRVRPSSPNAVGVVSSIASSSAHGTALRCTSVLSPHLLPRRDVHLGVVATAIARKFARFVSSDKPDESEQKYNPFPGPNSGGSGATGGRRARASVFGSSGDASDRAAAEEQEKRYAAAADEYWQYQLFMAQRAREFRERSERKRAYFTQGKWDEPNAAGGGGGARAAGAGPGASQYTAYEGTRRTRVASVNPEVMTAQRVLGMPTTTPLTEEAVKAAFRAKAMTAHPDRPTGSAVEFRRVNSAYQTLIAHLNANPPAATRSPGETARQYASHPPRPPQYRS